MPTEITTLEEFKIAITTDKLVVIDFYADWCGPCRKFAPTFEKMSNDFENVVFYKINVDNVPEPSEICNVESLPSFCLFKNSKYLEKTVGAAETKLRDMIKKNL